MAELHFLEFDVCLDDPAQVATLQGTDGGQGQAVGAILAAPDDAAITYSAPLVEGTDPVVPPCITSRWFTEGDNFPTDKAMFERKTGGLFGLSFLFGTKHRYYWRGLFKYVPPAEGPSAPGSPDPIAQRRWCEGFELIAGDNGSAFVNRGSSRHTQGLGLAMRDYGNVVLSHTLAEFAAGFTSNKSWERFYVRPRVFPSAVKFIWRAKISGATAAGFALAITPSGQLACYQVSTASVPSLLGTAATSTVIDEWTKIDVLLQVGTGAQLFIYVNGALQMSFTGLSAEVAVGGTIHVSSEVGDNMTSSSISVSIDLDDWICADWPASAPTMVNAGPDWRSGSRVALLRPTGFGTGNVWAGDWKVLLQSPTIGSGVLTPAVLTSSVSGARLSVTTDYALEVQGDPNGQIGIVSMMVGLMGYRGGAPSGQVGYKIDGGADVLVNVTQVATPGWTYVMYRPSGLVVGQDFASLELLHTKAADALAAGANALQAQIEVLGLFGAEDIQPIVATFAELVFNGAKVNPHNAPYPRTPWAQSKVPPIAPIGIYTGTYVGNAAGVELSFKTPVHWIWTRNVTGVNAGTKWFAGGVAAHRGFDPQLLPEAIVQALQDPAFVPVAGEDGQETSYLVRIAGANAFANTAGQTYVYTAISDPGGRFLLTGSLKQCRGTANVDTALLSPGFLPEAGFFLTVGGSPQMFYKGPGHASASLSELDAAELANAVSWTEGHIVSRSAFHASTINAIDFALLRREDGNTKDPGSTDPYTEVLQVTSYTGDGAASRTVGLTPASGKRPVFAIVVPHNTAAYYRDHAHTGTTSWQAPSSANASTGITGGGIDSLSVGSNLNSVGIVYDVFVLPGSDTAGNGGFSVPGEFFPRPPDSPVDGAYDPTPSDPDDFEPPAPGPGPDTTSPVPAWPTGCIGATTQLINMALSRLGHTKFIVNVDTDQTVEATLARLHYTDAMNAVLRAWPWPFATRYALLANIPAVPVTDAINEDWQYAYRAPADMLFARRFVKRGTGQQRTWDPYPVTFRVGSDATGPLIYTSAVVEDAILEYTVNVLCPATAGDALFRSAFAWRMAHELAPGLSKDAKAAQFAYAMYKEQLPTAETVAANEQQQDIEARDASWIRDRE